VYHYREPVFLPKGSIVSMRYVSRNLAGDWVSLSGTFVRWNFQMAINGSIMDVGDYYLPLEKAEFISARDPLFIGAGTLRLGGTDPAIPTEQRALQRPMGV
jgi:hypothetical protein